MPLVGVEEGEKKGDGAQTAWVVSSDARDAGSV